MLVSMRFDLDRFLLYYSSKSCTSNYKGRSKNVSSRQNMCVLSLYHIYILRHRKKNMFDFLVTRSKSIIFGFIPIDFLLAGINKWSLIYTWIDIGE